jgi:hypothetical protein
MDAYNTDVKNGVDPNARYVDSSDLYHPVYSSDAQKALNWKIPNPLPAIEKAAIIIIALIIALVILGYAVKNRLEKI